jgi:murein DD-endopeptidase MepM/ murein hydrolase activator NlpD
LLSGAALALTVPFGLGPLTAGQNPNQPLGGGGVVGAISDPGAVSTPAPTTVVTAARATSGLPRPKPDPEVRIVTPRVAPPLESLTGYRWPLTKGRISLPFKEIPGGEWTRNGVRIHDGVDMASFCGAPIVAAHTGVVLAAGRRFDDWLGWLGDLGPYYAQLDKRHAWNSLPIVVVIDDANGYRSVYAHFRDITVKPGQWVRAGQLIGHEGATGHASGCHLHYGLFSPLETKVFGLRADIRKRMRLPATEIARVDPLRVLPRGDVALRTRQIGKAIDAIAADRAAAKSSAAAADAARGHAGAAPS